MSLFFKSLFCRSPEANGGHEFTHRKDLFEELASEFSGADTDSLEQSIQQSKEDYLRKVEILKQLRTIQNLEDEVGKSITHEDNWSSLNSKVQDFLLERRISKKDVNSKDEDEREKIGKNILCSKCQKYLDKNICFKCNTNYFPIFSDQLYPCHLPGATQAGGHGLGRAG